MGTASGGDHGGDGWTTALFLVHFFKACVPRAFIPLVAMVRHAIPREAVALSNVHQYHGASVGDTENARRHRGHIGACLYPRLHRFHAHTCIYGNFCNQAGGADTKINAILCTVSTTPECHKTAIQANILSISCPYQRKSAPKNHPILIKQKTV